MPEVNKAMLRKAFDKMDSDGSGELDRDELMQLMQIMEPRRGITNDELDDAMKEIDTGGDGLVDFDEFSAYWDKNMNEGGGMLSGLVSRMSSLTGSASDLALNQIKANRALIDEVTQRWSLDKVEEKEVKVNVLDKPTSELMMDDLRGAPLALLNQLLKKCAPGSREYKLVDSQIKKAGPATKAKGPATTGGRKKALDPKYTKYLNLGPGQLKLAVAEQQKILDKLKKGKPTQESRKRVYEVTKEIDEIGKIFADKVHYSGVMTKKGGKTGNKGADERWFALEDLGSGVYSLEYYEPKKYKLLGQIPIDNKCLLDAGEGNNKGTTTYTLDITCTDENRTYYLFTTKKTDRDTWLKYITKDAGVADMNATYDDDQEEEIDDEPEEDDDDDDLE